MIYDGGHLGRGAIKNIVEISTETTNIVNKHKHVDLSAGWADDSDETQILSAGLMLYTQDKAKINIKTRPVSKDGYLHI